MELVVTFPGNKKVDVKVGDFTVKTDQPAAAGGDGTAPSPFEVFLASIGACSGVYVLDFCKNRGIDYSGIRIVQRMERNPESKMIEKISLDIEVPKDFPAKYNDALVHVADLCTVKKHIMKAPAFEIRTVMKD